MPGRTKSSTYIQERLRRNRDLLQARASACRIHWTASPNRKTRRRAVPKDKTLKPSSVATERSFLLSAEQFAVTTDPDCIQQLEAMADEAGCELHIVIFIRSQLDYINSRYIYSLRRFYHHQTFEQFVGDALKGKLQNEKAARQNRTATGCF